MFCSVADTWRNVLTNMADFKELVPEFYDTSNNGDFLCNKFGINFGYRSDNQRVNDVELPPWAKGNLSFSALKLKTMITSLNSYFITGELTIIITIDITFDVTNILLHVTRLISSNQMWAISK